MVLAFMTGIGEEKILLQMRSDEKGWIFQLRLV
jgi:hypothetical protein